MKLRTATAIFYFTTVLAAVQSVFGELTTTDYAHEIFSSYFFLELIILALVFLFNLQSRWVGILIVCITVSEVVLFYVRDLPLSPDDLLMVLIFLMRVYLIISLLRNPIRN